jgi:hypothetical protein
MKFGINDILFLISHIHSPIVKGLQTYEVEMSISHSMQDPEMLYSIKTWMLHIFFYDNDLQKAKQNDSPTKRVSGFMNMGNKT